MSLAKIDEKLGQKRRQREDAIKARGDMFAKLDALTDVIDALQAKESLTAEEASDLEAKLNAHKADKRATIAKGDEIAKLESEIRDLESERAAREEQARAEASLSQGSGRRTPHEQPSAQDFDVRVGARTAEQDDHDIASFLRCQYIALDQRMNIRDVVAGRAGDQYRNDRLSAAFNATDNSAVIPLNYQPRLIELLRAKSVVRQMGPRTIPLVNGNLRIPRQTSGSTAAYASELANIAVSDVGTDSINLSAKKLTCLVVSSGEMMRRASPATDAIIRDDMIKGIATKEDATFLRATGDSTTPAGIKSFADAASSTQRLSANTTLSVANVTYDIGRLILALEGADSPMDNCYFLMSPRTKRYLMDLRDGNGNMAFPEVARGELRGYPFLTTTQIPNNLTVSGTTGCSELYFLDASELIIADTPTFDVKVSDTAAYHDGSNVVAAFSKDAVVFRVIVEHDTALRHAVSAAYLNRVTWAN